MLGERLKDDERLKGEERLKGDERVKGDERLKGDDLLGKSWKPKLLQVMFPSGEVMFPVVVYCHRRI